MSLDDLAIALALAFTIGLPAYWLGLVAMGLGGKHELPSIAR